MGTKLNFHARKHLKWEIMNFDLKWKDMSEQMNISLCSKDKMCRRREKFATFEDIPQKFSLEQREMTEFLTK